MPHKALLSASRRSRPGHRASAQLDRRRAGVDARLARRLFRPVSADLRARHPWRLWQVANRAELLAGLGGGERRRRGLSRRSPPLSAGAGRLAAQLLQLRDRLIAGSGAVFAQRPQTFAADVAVGAAELDEAIEFAGNENREVFS